MALPYAGTQVTVSASAEGIRQILRKFEGERVVVGETADGHIAVEWHRANVLYRVQIPAVDVDQREERRLWRVLYWAIKSKSESVSSGLDQYEVAFMGQIVDPASGATLSQIIVPMIESGAFAIGGAGLRALPGRTG